MILAASTPVDDEPAEETNETEDSQENQQPAAETTAPEPAEPEEPKLSPLQQAELEHYRQIRELSDEVACAKSEWASLKDRAAAKKKEFEALQGELNSLIRRGPEPQKKFPFREGEKAGEQPSGEADADSEASKQPANPDAWRSVPVSELGLQKSLVTKLENEHLGTLGDLSDFWKARKSLTDIKGIGGAKSDAVADAFAEYGKVHPEVFGQTDSSDGLKVVSPPDKDDEASPDSNMEDADDEEVDEDSVDEDWEEGEL